jgi:hypothetical protein
MKNIYDRDIKYGNTEEEERTEGTRLLAKSK